MNAKVWLSIRNQFLQNNPFEERIIYQIAYKTMKVYPDATSYSLSLKTRTLFVHMIEYATIHDLRGNDSGLVETIRHG